MNLRSAEPVHFPNLGPGFNSLMKCITSALLQQTLNAQLCSKTPVVRDDYNRRIKGDNILKCSNSPSTSPHLTRKDRFR